MMCMFMYYRRRGTFGVNLRFFHVYLALCSRINLLGTIATLCWKFHKFYWLTIAFPCRMYMNNVENKLSVAYVIASSCWLSMPGRWFVYKNTQLSCTEPNMPSSFIWIKLARYLIVYLYNVYVNLLS